MPQERKLQISNTLKRIYKLYDKNGKFLIINDMVDFCKKNNFGKSARNCLAMLANKGFYNGRGNGKIYRYTSYKGYTSTIT